MKIELLPHKGVIVEDKLIEIGNDINFAELGYDFENYDNTYYLFDSNMQIETEDNKVAFIQCCIGEESPIKPFILGHNLYQLEADKIVEILNEVLGENATVVENGHTYMWSESDVSCWREMTVEEVEELIAETKADGMYEEMKEEIERDICRSRYFETIGIGRKGYHN